MEPNTQPSRRSGEGYSWNSSCQEKNLQAVLVLLLQNAVQIFIRCISIFQSSLLYECLLTLSVTLPWVPEPKNDKKIKNKEGEKVGSGQMVTSIVGIDQ